MHISNPTDTDLELAALLGQFGQSACYLEQAVEVSITRLLPLTNSMGTVLLAANPLSRNLKILEGLLSLPETQVSEEWRERLKSACTTAWSLISDRNKLLHGRIIDGRPAFEGYVLVQHQSDERGDRSSAMPIDITYFVARNRTMQEVTAVLMTVPQAEYDLSQWSNSYRTYKTKPYPTAKPQDPQRPKDRN